MITTNNDNYAEVIRELLNHGIIRDVKGLFLNVSNNNGTILNKNKPKLNEEKAPWLYQQINLGQNYRIQIFKVLLDYSAKKKSILIKEIMFI